MKFSEIRLQIKSNFSSPVEIYILLIFIFFININNIFKKEILNKYLKFIYITIKKTNYKLILFI